MRCDSSLQVTAERTALEGLLATKMPQFYRAAARVLQNPQDSEDALQDGLLSAFLHLDQFQGRSSLATWMHSVVSNAARMQLRRRNRLSFTSVDQDFGEDGEFRGAGEVAIDARPSPEEDSVWQERSRMLRARMNSLPPHYRRIIQMCIIDGLLRREAAQILGVSVGTVKARLHRACALLVKQL